MSFSARVILGGEDLHSGGDGRRLDHLRQFGAGESPDGSSDVVIVMTIPSAQSCLSLAPKRRCKLARVVIRGNNAAAQVLLDLVRLPDGMRPHRIKASFHRHNSSSVYDRLCSHRCYNSSTPRVSVNFLFQIASLP
jgi:hypothetical protein